MFSKSTMFLFFLLLIISPHYLQALTWSFGQPVSCCQTYPVTTPAPVKCVPCQPTTSTPKKAEPVIEPCCVTQAKPCKPCVPVYPVKTTPTPPLYTVSPCLPPTCYSDVGKQKVELEKIYQQGSHLMVKYSSAATEPVIYAAQTISNGADLIPSVFAAGGDLLGKAIASPIQFFNRIGFSLLSGAISQVVTIPISFGTSVRASTVLMQPYLRWFGLGGKDAPHTCCPSPPIPGAFEQIGLKPIGILTGPVHLALGSVLTLGGSTFRLIGTLTKNSGEYFQNTGHGFKNVGALKVGDGIKSVASFLSIIDNPHSQTICIDNGKNITFYEKTDNPTTLTPVYSTTMTPYAKVEIPTTPKPVLTTAYATVTTIKETPKYVPTTTLPPPTTSESYLTTQAFVSSEPNPYGQETPQNYDSNEDKKGDEDPEDSEQK